jgi:predicted Zn-dependent protease
MDKARRAFEAVLALCPGDQAASRSLAAVEVREGNGARALELLRESLGGPLSSKEAVLLLLKAGAYSLEGRSDEAALAADEYRRLSGGGR